MATTGIEIRKILEQKVDKAYTGYKDPIKINRLLKDCLTAIIDQKIEIYRTNQKIADEISPFLVYGKQVAPYQNKIRTANIHVVNITYLASTVTVTAEEDLQVNVGDLLSFSATPAGIANIDQSFIVLTLSGKMFTFTNVLGTPTGTYTAYSGTLNNANYLDDYYRLLNAELTFAGNITSFIANPDHIAEKGKVFGQATTRHPKVEIASNVIHIEPSSVVCSLAKFFYFKKPARYIDVDNSVYDYSLFLNEKMISHLTNVAARNWAAFMSHNDMFKTEQLIISDNP